MFSIFINFFLRKGFSFSTAYVAIARSLKKALTSWNIKMYNRVCVKYRSLCEHFYVLILFLNH